MKKTIILLILSISFIFAQEGILRISSNMQDVDIYNNNQQIAMLGEDYTDIKLPKGKYKIILKKKINQASEYYSSKNVFVGANTFTKLNFVLKKQSNNTHVNTKKSIPKSKKIIYTKHIEEMLIGGMRVKTKYRFLDNDKIEFTLNSYRNGSTAKAGASISFPQFKNDSRILKKYSSGFKKINTYKKGSKIWNAQLKKTIKSSYLLVEGWTDKWESFKSKEIKLIINVKNLNNLIVQVRSNGVSNKKELNTPNMGEKDQQGMYSKIINIQVKNKSYNDFNKYLYQWDNTNNKKNSIMVSNLYNYGPIIYNNKKIQGHSFKELKKILNKKNTEKSREKSELNIGDIKYKFFKNNRDFKQSSTLRSIENLGDDTYKINYNKYTISNKKKTNYDSYLIVENRGRYQFTIIEDNSKRF
jgi:hypothetical protein